MEQTIYDYLNPKEKINFGDTVHIECINKTGLVVKIHENVLGIDLTTYFVKFSDGTIGNFCDESVELVSQKPPVFIDVPRGHPNYKKGESK